MAVNRNSTGTRLSLFAKAIAKTWRRPKTPPPQIDPGLQKFRELWLEMASGKDVRPELARLLASPESVQISPRIKSSMRICTICRPKAKVGA